MALLREDHTAPPRPSTWTYHGWHQDCTNPLHSALVQANDSSGYKNANIACQGVTAPPRPSTWTFEGWHQDCTNLLHSVLVRANDSSGYKNANIACQGVTAPPRPSTWTGWHQDCTNPLHSVLVRANDSSGYKNATIACQVTRMQCNIEGMVVHRKHSRYSAVTSDGQNLHVRVAHEDHPVL